MWEITDLGLAGRRRRPLSPRSRQFLARALHLRSLNGVTGQERARTAARIRTLRSSPDAAQLLTEWWGGDAAETGLFASTLLQHAIAGHRDHVDAVLRRPRREYLRSRDDLADVVSTERAIQGLSIKQLATVAGVSTDDVRQIERAAPVRSPAVVRRILGAIDIDPTALPEPAA